MSYPQPPYGGPNDPNQYPGGYSPLPGGDPGYGPPSGQQPAQGWPAAPSGPQQPYPGQYQQPYPGQQYQQPGGPASSDDRTMAMLAHLGGILFGFLAPLIIYFVKKDESPFVRDQAARAFNFQITMTIGHIVSWVLMFVFIGFLTWFAVIILALVYSIMGAVAANKGEWFRYPGWLAIPMLS
ncbi:MAG: DUF4870 domain-containing protein [Nocardiopsaceae bacterium]|nr:DUF4870 domain-containing protein [Nocardiopsaceae bacterium]